MEYTESSDQAVVGESADRVPGAAGASSRDIRQVAKAAVEAQVQKTADVLHK